MTVRVPTHAPFAPWALALAVLAVVVMSTPAGAFIDNPGGPADGVQTLSPTEKWRAGGEDDDIFFGSVGRVLAGPAGTVLVLDTQLSQAQVYGRDGTWLRTVGREGDGPGEVRGPADMWTLPDGRLCIAQSFPGRLVYLDPDGTPAGQAQYQPAGKPATFTVAVGGRPAPAGMILAGIRFNQSGGPQAEQTFFLSSCDVEGREQTVFLEKSYAINYADFRLDEAAMDFVWVDRMDVDAEGNVYTAPVRDRYLIRVQDPEGNVLREFGRPITMPERTERERTTATKILEGVGANYQVPVREITIEDHEPAISGLHVRPDGEVWVRTPVNEVPDGAFTIFDVFDREGQYVRQVVLDIPGDAGRDRPYLLRDGRLVVVLGELDAWLGQQGVESDNADAPVLELVSFGEI
jgi:hypothetical protein